MSDPEFGIDVPEADRLEQLQDASPDSAVDDYQQDDLPTVETSSANPADVLEQHVPVAIPEDEDDR